MKSELIIFGITIFFIFNTYSDGKYVKIVKSWKKYYQMAGIGFIGLSAYIFMRKYPSDSQNLLRHANGMIKYMPIDKDASDLLTPFLMHPQEQRIMTSGGDATSRSVSGTKKKWVAAQQSWKCKDCQSQLDAWFEVDHKIRLADGGSNQVDNLVALCRNCHGKKTSFENL